MERGTHPGQRTVVDTLGGIAARVEAEELRRAGDHPGRPGRRAPRDDRLAGAPPAARRGRGGHARTRAGERAGGAAARAGAEVVETPAIRIEPRPVDGELLEAIDRIEEYALVCLTSPNGVRLLFDALAKRVGSGDARALAGARDGGGHRARARRRSCSRWHPGGRRAGALRGRGTRGGPRAVVGGGPARAGRARRGGPQRPARRAPRARRWWTRSPSTRRSPSRSRTPTAPLSSVPPT